MENHLLNMPRRLSELTHKLCKRAMSGEFGKALTANYCAIVDDPDYEKLDPFRQYNVCIKAIVEQAPIRLTDGELLSGSATLNKAREHEVPAALKSWEDQSKSIFRARSHLTPHYQKVLKGGVCGLEEEIAYSRQRNCNRPERLAYLDQMEVTISHLKYWHRRYLDALSEKIAQTEGETKSRWEQIHKHLSRVPMEPARNFREAVQSLWFMFCFQRLTGNWAAVGRVDWMLGPYLKKDLAEGVITLDEAREYIAHFWIKGCEWVDTETCIGHAEGSGDGQFFQNVVLSGQDAQGNDETNEVTYLVLDVLEELRIADYPTSVRICKSSPEKLIRRVAQIICLGGGLLAVYNDDTVIEALVRFGYSRQEACRYANDGCWEVQIPGKTNFSYWSWDVLADLQQAVLKLAEPGPSALPYESFEDLYDAYIRQLKARYHEFSMEKIRFAFCPNIAISLLVENCILNGTDFGYKRGGGAIYEVEAPHAGGLPDAANALQAIRWVVYEKKMMSLNEFMDIVKADWAGHEALRMRIRNELVYDGNGDPEGDAMMQRLYDAYVNDICNQKFFAGVLFPAGISTFGRQVTPEFLDHRTANPDGHKKGDFLSNNISPTPGTDFRGATATLRSYGALDMRKLPNGTALEIKLSYATVRGDDGLEGLVDLLYAFCELGCHFMQLDVVDADMLKQAQEDPENYGNLTVRVSGWSSRFRTLSQNWQRMVIERTEMGY